MFTPIPKGLSERKTTREIIMAMGVNHNHFGAEAQMPSVGTFLPAWPQPQFNVDLDLRLSVIIERYEKAITNGPADSLSLLGMIVNDPYRFLQETPPVR